MSDPAPLCCPQDVRQFTNIDPNFKGIDKSLLAFITTVSSQVRLFCRRDFVKKERVQTYMSIDGARGPYTMYTPEDNLDQSALFSLKYNKNGDFRTGYAYIIPMSDMVVDFERGQITVNGYGFQPARKGFQLTYTAGYPAIQVDGADMLDVPAAVRQATAMQCAHMLAKTRAGALGKTSIAQNSGITENYDRGGTTGLIREVSGALLEFRRKFVGRT